MGRGGFGTNEKAYSWVIEPGSSKVIGYPGRVEGSKRLTCDGEFFHALKDVQSLYVIFKKKEEILERPRSDRERILPGKSLWKPSDERYQRIGDLSIQGGTPSETSYQLERRDASAFS